MTDEKEAIDGEAVALHPNGLELEFTNYVETTNELGLFLIIQAMGALMSQMGSDLRAQPELLQDPETLRQIAGAAGKTTGQIHYAIQQTKRFGITPFEGTSNLPSEDYVHWFRWWGQYITGLPEEKWLELKDLIENDEPHDEWRPEGNYRAQYEDGVVPVAWLVRIVTPKAAERQHPQLRGALSETWKNLLSYLEGNELWHYRDDTDGVALGARPERGYCVVRDRRPIARLAIPYGST